MDTTNKEVKLNNQPHLIVVSTPIGNLQEINQRAVNAFVNNQYFLVEDSRNTTKLFQLLNLDYKNKRFIVYHKYNEQAQLEQALQVLSHDNLVLVSDAGYPAFSDPGYVIINACNDKNIFVEVINGANAFLDALIVSGWSNEPTCFFGFVDWTKKQTINYPNTILCFYEAVHRINETLKLMANYFGDVPVCVVKELTKLNETHYFGSLKSMQIPNQELKGEFVIIINNLIHPKNDVIDLKSLVDDFNTFNHSFDKANLKQRIKLYLALNHLDDIKANDLYELIIKNKTN